MATMLQSSGGEVEMREEGCSPTELCGGGNDRSPGDKPMAGDRGGATFSPGKGPGTKSPPGANGFQRDPKVQCMTTRVYTQSVAEDYMYSISHPRQLLSICLGGCVVLCCVTFFLRGWSWNVM